MDEGLEKGNDEKIDIMETYTLKVGKRIVDVTIYKAESETVPTYNISLLNLTPTTQHILDKLREEFVSRINVDVSTDYVGVEIEEIFQKEISILIKRYFPDLKENDADLLINYVVQQSLGLGDIETLLKDSKIEEIVINKATDPVWIYHRGNGWLKTNIFLKGEDQTRHYSTKIGREVGKDITILRPLMDAHLKSGHRVNATLSPISEGNTITIRKFSEKPWSIVDLIKVGTMNTETAALVWLGIQSELSMIIAGGTSSGKTSALNSIATFFPPNQRIISIEDTRELQLPDTLHWVPMETRLPNPEGKGGVSMLDLVVNSLRMRPDRIVMGEVRKKEEAEVLFEAMHTGHSVYGTLHANNAEETISRLTSPPIQLPKSVVSSLSMILIQNRNRRTGKCRTLQLAEVTKEGDPKVLVQLDAANDKLKKVSEVNSIMESLNLYTGMTFAEVQKDLKEKTRVLKWLVAEGIDDVQNVGLIMSRYYAGKLRI